MLSIPIRKSEQVNLSRSLDAFTINNYDKETQEKLHPFFAHLDDFRKHSVESLDSSDFESAVQSLEFYLSGLTFLGSRIPISSTDLKFNWTDSYLKTTQPVLTFSLEKICTAYSIAGCWSKLAADSDLKSQTGHKTALLGYQNALNWLGMCKKYAGEGVLGPRGEISLENFQVWSDIMTAQGYMTLYNRLDKPTAKKESISRLAYSICKNFESCLTALPNLKSFPKDYENLIRFYFSFFEAAGQFYQALTEKEKAVQAGSGVGSVVARLKLAEKCANKAIQVRGLKESLLDEGKSLLSEITEEKNSAESDNFSIYIERIPEESEVGLIETLNMIVSKDIILKDFPNKELIFFIVPEEILEIHQDFETFILSQFDLYKEKIETTLQDVKRSFEGKTFEGIPLNIWSQISEVQSKNCEKDVESIQSLKSAILLELKTMTESLFNEEAEDEELRKLNKTIWTRPQSSSFSQQLRKEIAVLNEKLEQANRTDEITFADFNTNKTTLDILCLSKADLDKFIPEIDSSTVSEKKRLTEELKQSENNLGELLKKYREAISSSQKSEELKKILDENLNRQAVFQDIDLEFSDYREQIDSEIEVLKEKQENYLQLLSGVSVEYSAAEFLDGILKALDIKRGLVARLDPGVEFYSKLGGRVVELKMLTEDFIKKREAEKKEILARASLDLLEPVKCQANQPVSRVTEDTVYQVPSNPNRASGIASGAHLPSGAGYGTYSAPQLPGYQLNNYSSLNYPPHSFGSANPQLNGSSQGYLPQGYSNQHHFAQSYPQKSYLTQGYPNHPCPQGYPPQVYSHQIYSPQGYSPQGYSPQNYPPQNYPPQNYPSQHYPSGSSLNAFQPDKK